MATTGKDKPLRAHAARNRDALIAAACDAFEAGELDIRIEEIARRAGVGVGTLYRHFATREALIEAVYRQRVEDLCGAVPRLLDELAPYDALRTFLRQLIAHSAASQGMAVALEAVMNTGSPVFAQARTDMTEAIATIMTAAVTAGEIRADVTPETVFRAMGGICTSHDQPDWEDGAHAIVRLLLDGLRSGAAVIPR
ncbi:TetR/AcrR family transcriptional regulator [Streptomyces sp. S465]|uniref:TetR/AcrR family transcriptional regulator n=1 Tax=Streptomyces sp. S465 TaxID=2979468 RepID=UPI0022A85F5D|nr:TetR/AcrR family transcriptional regulator [Streptomyces sp. S465]WAP56569.1 TetR/AcrR family transcriptional regulator [Streptomyces sp. S465]